MQQNIIKYYKKQKEEIKNIISKWKEMTKTKLDIEISKQTNLSKI